MDLSALKGRRVMVGVGGGIAAYKACELVRELQRAGAEVRVSMTAGAQQFVTALTFQSLSGHAVQTDVFDPSQEAAFGHIDLARWAELVVIAPATADLIARIRAGFGNDALTTTLLAYRGTVLLAPAMNTAMFENPQTQQNLTALAQNPKYRTVEPGSGLLACGEIGKGRLAEVKDIAAAAAQLFAEGPLSGKHVLVTAGPTREFLDPVRFISNPSTGKMGLAIAQAARRLGAKVTVVLGPVPEADRAGLEVIDVVTAEQMAEAVLTRVNEADVFVATAAVSDYRAETPSPQKRKKGEGPETVVFVRTPDVLLEASKRVAALPSRPLLVGFAAETQDLVQHAQEKLVKKNLDFIVANDVTRPGAGFGGDSNHVLVIGRSGAPVELSGTKREVAERVWELLRPVLARRSPAERAS